MVLRLAGWLCNVKIDRVNSTFFNVLVCLSDHVFVVFEVGGRVLETVKTNWRTKEKAPWIRKWEVLN